MPHPIVTADQVKANKQMCDAAAQGDLDTIKSLYCSEPPPHPDCLKWAFLRAARYGHHLAVAQFMDRGSDVKFTDQFGFTAAHQFCRDARVRDCPTMLQTLFRDGLSWIDQQNSRGETCLHLAARSSASVLVQWLLEAGANAMIEDMDGNTAFDLLIAQFMGHRYRYEYSAPEKQEIINTYRTFVQHAVKSGVSNTVLDPMYASNVSEMDVYEIPSASMVALFFLLERSTFDKVSEQVCQQIRRDVCHFVGTSNGLKYREPACNLATSSSALEGPVPSYLSIVMPIIYIAVPEFVVGDHESLQFARKRVDLKFNHCNIGGSDLYGFDGPLTLDEYCYPALPTDELRRRNRNQTLTRLTENDLMAQQKLIMVDQAWIWQTREMRIATTLGTDFIDGFQESSFKKGASSSYEEIGIYLADLIDSAAFNEAFEDFQIAIGKLVEDVGQYIKMKGVTSVNVGREHGFCNHINDIREELSMIRRVIVQQDEVWREFASNAWPEVWAECEEKRMRISSEPHNDSQGEDPRALIRLIMRPRLCVQKSLRRLSQLDEDAERVERLTSIQLDLKQNHASLQVSHVIAIMSTSIFGLMIIMIIFSSLSFVLSLLALPIDYSQDGGKPSPLPNAAGFHSTIYFRKWTATGELVSVTITLTALWIGLEYGLKYPVAQTLRQYLLKLFSEGRAWAKEAATRQCERLWSRRSNMRRRSIEASTYTSNVESVFVPPIYLQKRKLARL